MRSSKSRSRSKSNRQRSLGNIINRVFDSSGPEGKVRGTPQQIIEKYLALARDAQLSNDRVLEQAFFQHAEHYTRMLGEAQRELAREQENRQQQGQPGGGGNGQGGYRDDRGDRGDRNERQGDGRGDRGDQRPMRGEQDEQPDFAPLGGVTLDDPRDEGPGLVETPEMYHETRPREPAEALAKAAAERGSEQGGERPASAKGERGPRGPRGPRKPRADRQGGAGPEATAPESSDAE